MNKKAQELAEQRSNEYLDILRDIRKNHELLEYIIYEHCQDRNDWYEAREASRNIDKQLIKLFGYFSDSLYFDFMNLKED